MLSTKFVYRDKFPATYQLYTATLVILKKICTWTAKIAPYRLAHRDKFRLKHRDRLPDGLSPVTLTCQYPPAVSLHGTQAHTKTIADLTFAVLYRQITSDETTTTHLSGLAKAPTESYI